MCDNNDYREDELFMYFKDKIIVVKSSETNIFSDDPRVIEKLKERINRLQKEKEKVKAREHCYYELPYINTEIRKIQSRIEYEKYLKDLEFEDMIFDGWKIIYNKELDKIQIFFDRKPDNDILWILEYRGFRWRKKLGAWQLSFNTETVYLAKTIAEEIQNRR